MNCESCGHRIQQNVNEPANIDLDGNIICPKCNEGALKLEVKRIFLLVLVAVFTPFINGRECTESELAKYDQ